MQPLKDKVMLITGSSRGIGKAVAHRAARAGADIVINHRKDEGPSREKAEELREAIVSMGQRALVVQADISQRDDVKRLFAETSGFFGRLDYLILNAARAPFKPFEKLFEREIRQLVDTNFVGNIFCIQEAVPLLEKTRGGIVFVSSLGSRFYNPDYPLGSMKAAMESVVRDCSESLRSKSISVNAVCGGIVKTDSFRLLRRLWHNIDLLPDDLFVEPEEMADVVLFLCCPEARAIAGQALVVDKGLSTSLFRSVQTGQSP